MGVPFPPLRERYERLEETIQICFQMWSDDNGPFEGTHYQLAETLCSPAPVSAPRPRLLIGGGGERKTLRLVAVDADVCNIIGDAAVVRHKVEVLHGHCADVGREPETIEVTALMTIAEDANFGTSFWPRPRHTRTPGPMRSSCGRPGRNRLAGWKRHGGPCCLVSHRSADLDHTPAYVPRPRPWPVRYVALPGR